MAKEMLCVGRIGPYKSVATGEDAFRAVHVETHDGDQKIGWQILLDTDMHPDELKMITSHALEQICIALYERRS